MSFHFRSRLRSSTLTAVTWSSFKTDRPIGVHCAVGGQFGDCLACV